MSSFSYSPVCLKFSFNMSSCAGSLEDAAVSGGIADTKSVKQILPVLIVPERVRVWACGTESFHTAAFMQSSIWSSCIWPPISAYSRNLHRLNAKESICASLISTVSISAFVIVTVFAAAFTKQISLNVVGRGSNKIVVLLVLAHKKSRERLCDISIVSISTVSAFI